MIENVWIGIKIPTLSGWAARAEGLITEAPRGNGTDFLSPWHEMSIELLNCWSCQNWLGAESVLYFSFWSNDPGMKWIKFCEERNLWKVWAIPGELGFYFPPQSLATWGLTTRTNNKIPNSKPIDLKHCLLCRVVQARRAFAEKFGLGWKF